MLEIIGVIITLIVKIVAYFVLPERVKTKLPVVYKIG